MNGEIRQRRGPRKATNSYLRNAALYYLERFATSSANLRRILLRKVKRSVRHHGTDEAEGAAAVDALIAGFEASGLLNDRAYAEALVDSLRRRGGSTRAIRAKLMAKGIDPEIVNQALVVDAEDYREPELTAALALARRRRLGPYRAPEKRQETRQKDLAALARAGFSYDIARKVIEAETAEELEAEIS